MPSKKFAVLKTLSYSDLFSFPLLLSEITRYWEGTEKINETECYALLRSLHPLVKEKHGYYFFSGREKIVTRRIRQLRFVMQKRQIAQKVAAWLSIIPSILLIGMSGGVAVGSARKDDDIDFFIITKKNTLFLTRFFVLLILQLTGYRRKRLGDATRDTICVNMLLDESMMRIETRRRDIYTAREIAQLVPLFERENAYRKFLSANSWVRTYLPNAGPYKARIEKKRAHFWENIFAVLPVAVTEHLFKVLQLKLILSHHTSEAVGENFLAFHPHDYRISVLKERDKRIKKIASQLFLTGGQSSSSFLDKEKNIFYTA